MKKISAGTTTEQKKKNEHNSKIIHYIDSCAKRKTVLVRIISGKFNKERTDKLFAPRGNLYNADAIKNIARTLQTRRTVWKRVIVLQC